MADKDTRASAGDVSARNDAAPAQRGSKPPRGTPWRHQDGCKNPVADDWNCECGPEVIED